MKPESFKKKNPSSTASTNQFFQSVIGELLNLPRYCGKNLLSISRISNLLQLNTFPSLPSSLSSTMSHTNYLHILFLSPLSSSVFLPFPSLPPLAPPEKY